MDFKETLENIAENKALRGVLVLLGIGVSVYTLIHLHKIIKIRNSQLAQLRGIHGHLENGKTKNG